MTREQQIKELEDVYLKISKNVTIGLRSELDSFIDYFGKALLIISELQKENKNLKAKLDYVGDVSFEENKELKKHNAKLTNY